MLLKSERWQDCVRARMPLHALRALGLAALLVLGAAECLDARFWQYTPHDIFANFARVLRASAGTPFLTDLSQWSRDEHQVLRARLVPNLSHHLIR